MLKAFLRPLAKLGVRPWLEVYVRKEGGEGKAGFRRQGLPRGK